MTMGLTPFTPDCGHTVTPTPLSIGTGRATDPKTGRTMCYPCAEAVERGRIEDGVPTGVYLSSDEKTVTTWTGAVLGKVTSVKRGAKRFGKDGSWRMRTVYVTTPDGNKWSGRGSDDMDAVTIRRLA